MTSIIGPLRRTVYLELEVIELFNIRSIIDTAIYGPMEGNP